PERLAAQGDPMAGIDGQHFSLEELLTMYARDEEQGAGDMPYPPEYPKMPGEPMRVQPSRKRRVTTDGA
ncbi:MAG: ATP-dependent DNA ligase, partial [Nocardioides sp.]